MMKGKGISIEKGKQREQDRGEKSDQDKGVVILFCQTWGGGGCLYCEETKQRWEERMNNDQNIMLSKAHKRVKGHIDDEELWNMRKCLVGEMETVCSVSSLNDRLHNWGMGEISVQRMSAKTFLLTIEDEDLFLLLEDLE
ncbi:hypothetical protein V6N13_137878 [Hibiscus sabdariffa]